MKKDSFAMAESHQLPGCAAEAISEWVDFASKYVDNEHFVDFIPENDKPIAIERWLSCIYAGFYFVKKEFGEKIAGKIGISAWQEEFIPRPLRSCNAEATSA